MPLSVMELWAAINKADILIEINLGLIDDLKRPVFCNLNGVKDGQTTRMNITYKIIWAKINCTWQRYIQVDQFLGQPNGKLSMKGILQGGK
jgi:hypothetical protein